MLKDAVLQEFTRSYNSVDFQLLRPKRSDFGDYSVNVHRLAASTSPENIDALVKDLSQSPMFAKVEKKGTFVNVFLSQKMLMNELGRIIGEKNSYGQHISSQPETVSLEFGQPNTHKLPHIGHLFSYIFGESCGRILENGGNRVSRCNYQGDIGLHVAQCLYYIEEHQDELTKLQNIHEKIAFMQKAYQEGSAAYESSADSQDKINKINKKLYEADPLLIPLWETTRAWSLEYLRAFEKRLGISYDAHYFESETGAEGIRLVKKNIGTVFEEHDGAIIFRGEKYNLHTRVFITHNETPTYEAKDVGLASYKLKSTYVDRHNISEYESTKIALTNSTTEGALTTEIASSASTTETANITSGPDEAPETPFDRFIIHTATEQNAYWDVLKKVIGLVLPQLEGRIHHVGFGMVNLKAGKMSSRKGNIISAADLFEHVKKEVRTSLFKDKNTQDETLEIISEGALKYAFLKSEAKKNISFDIDESISLQGNSGPYLQYAYARTQSVISKAEEDPNTNKASGASIRALQSPIITNDTANGLTPEELALLRELVRFPEVTDDANRYYAPHLICTYLFEVGKLFNNFYEKHPILNAESDVRAFRLSLTQATGHVIKNGLYLLGIRVVDKI